MKPISSLLLSVLLFSCGATTSKSDHVDQSDNWQKSNHVYTVNTYSKSGLLDTSYKTTYLYQDGMLVDTFKSIIVRQYKNSTLTNERGYTLSPNGTKSLSHELIKQYDAKGNLTLQINKMSGDIVSKTTMKYNNQGQIVEAINLFQILEDNPNDYILDSAVLHQSDKKSLRYDTTIITYQYDDKGKEIKTVTANTRGEIQKVSFSKYSGDELSLSFDLAPQGDTLSTITYLKEGSLIKQIADFKEMGSVDTMWLDKGKVIKVIGGSTKMNMRYKHISVYNDKGDEIESISYN